MKWIALFSQSGRELNSICSNIGFCPDIILTNNSDKKTWYEDTYKLPRIAIMKTNDINSFLINREPAVITMHGYNRILPLCIVKKHQVYNGHPGDIIKYPQLKGKDPQKKALDMKLSSSGVVIHRATEDVDSGDIYRFKRVNINPFWTPKELIDHLRSASIDIWSEFIVELMWEHRQTRGGI